MTKMTAASAGWASANFEQRMELANALHPDADKRALMEVLIAGRRYSLLDCRVMPLTKWRTNMAAKWVVDVKGCAGSEAFEITVLRDDYEHGKRSFGWMPAPNGGGWQRVLGGE
jgi:hypothetical protein